MVTRVISVDLRISGCTLNMFQMDHISTKQLRSINSDLLPPSQVLTLIRL